MKRIFSFIFRALFVLAGAAACIYLYLYVTGYFTPAPAVGYIHSPSRAAYLDLDVLKNELAAGDVSLLESEEGEAPAAAAQRLLELGARVLIVGQDDPQVGSALLDAAAQAGATLVFVGSDPGAAVLASSDKAWYLGSEAAHGGELLGKQVALAYRDGVIADENGDHLLQYALFQTESGGAHSQFARYALEECEHYGVYTALLEYADEEGAPLPFNAERLTGQQKPEFILCTSPQDARTAYAVAQELGWLEGDAPVRIGAVAQNRGDAQALVADGVALAVPYYDPQAAARAAAAMAQNAMAFRFIGQDTGLSPDVEGRFILPFQLIQ